jgi:DNA-binding response OmpR family regulator
VYIEKLKEWLAGQAAGTNAAAAVNIPRTAGDNAALDKVFGALIMMVDDEPLVLEVTQVQLEEAGFSRFVTTSNAVDALALIAERRPDLLLLDLMMPGMSGFDILARMEANKILKEVPTIVLTSASDAATRLKALELGVTEFLIKPVDPLELVLRVSNTLAAKAYWQGCWAPQ